MTIALSVFKCAKRSRSCVSSSRLLLPNENHARVFRRSLKCDTFNFHKKQHILLKHQLKVLENNVKAFYWARKHDVWSIVTLIEETGNASNVNYTFILKCCGRLMIEATPVDRSRLLSRVWSLLKGTDHNITIEHYNALLQARLDNKEEFQVKWFLQDMAKCKIEPNYDTYKILMKYCYQTNDVNSAILIMNTMRNRMVLKDDIVSLLVKMKISGPYAADKHSADVCSALIYTDIQQNDKANVKKVLDNCTLQGIKLRSENLVDIIVTLLKNNELELVESVMDVMQITNNLASEMTILQQLIHIDKLDYALRIFHKLMSLQSSQPIRTAAVDFFLSELVKHRMKITDIVHVCDIFAAKEYVECPLFMALKYTLMYYRTEENYELLEVCLSKGYCIRSHLFWPILNKALTHYDYSGAIKILNLMQSKFRCPPCIKTVQNYSFSFNLFYQVTRDSLIREGIASVTVNNALVLFLLNTTKIGLAGRYIKRFPTIYWNTELQDALMFAFCARNDVQMYLFISKHLYESRTYDHTSENFSALRKVPIEEQLLHLLEFQPSNKHYMINVLKQMSKEGLSISESAAHILGKSLGKFLDRQPGLLRAVTECSDTYRYRRSTEFEHPRTNERDAKPKFRHLYRIK